MKDNLARNVSNGIILHVVDLPKTKFTDKLNLKHMKKTNVSPKKQTIPRKVYFTMFMSELLGTALLMFLGCMGCIKEVDDPPAVHHMSSLAFGLVILLIIQGFGHISGAHLNPAVTLAALIFKVLTPVMSFVYIAAQFIGAILGFALLRILIPEKWSANGFCVTKPHELTSDLQALVIETIITAVLIIIVCAVWDKRNETKQDSTPLRFAFVVSAISMVAGPLTGASMNTARSFPPALFWGNYQSQWIYLVGPNVGAILGCGIYSCIFSIEDKDPSETEKDLHLEEAAAEMISKD